VPAWALSCRLPRLPRLPGCLVARLTRHEFRHVFVERKMLSNQDFKSILRATNEDAGGRAVPRALHHQTSDAPSSRRMALKWTAVSFVSAIHVIYPSDCQVRVCAPAGNSGRSDAAGQASA
jgi:hypothetical protein